MDTVFESPVPVLVAGILVEAMLGIVFVNTRRGAVLAWMAGVLVLTLAGVGLERLIQTDREKVESALYGAADALVTNDLDQVNQYVAESAMRTRVRAKGVLSMVEFTHINLSDLEIRINKLTSPPSAEVKFTGNFHFRDKTGQIYREFYRAGFTVELELQGDRWLITDHIEHHDMMR